MLSSVLNSERAIHVNIQIIRIFTKMRELISTHKDILIKMDQHEKYILKHDKEIIEIFNVLRELLNPPQKPLRKIGYKK